MRPGLASHHNCSDPRNHFTTTSSMAATDFQWCETLGFERLRSGFVRRFAEIARRNTRGRHSRALHPQIDLHRTAGSRSAAPLGRCPPDRPLRKSLYRRFQGETIGPHSGLHHKNTSPRRTPKWRLSTLRVPTCQAHPGNNEYHLIRSKLPPPGLLPSCLIMAS
jgi:hypothetical protein